MSVIAPDQYVILEYRLRLDSGEQIRGTAEAPAYLKFIAGCNELMPALERRLLGLREQDAVEFVIPAEEAFGEYDPENIQAWSHKVFPPEMELQVGQQVIPANLPFPPEYPLIVKEVTEELRHPGYEPPPGRPRSALSGEGHRSAARYAGGVGTAAAMQVLLRRDGGEVFLRKKGRRTLSPSP